MGEEQVTIHAADGVELRGDLTLPPGGEPAVVVALGHSMMADRRSLDRPEGAGLYSVLAAAGLGVLRIDLRGHGDSAPFGHGRGRWTYDDLVADVGPVNAYLAGRFPGAARVAVGHSLFGHAALAHQAVRPAGAPGFDRLVLIGSSVWASAFEPNRARWLLKSVLARAGRRLLPRRGVLPVRRLRVGSADESIAFLRQMFGWVVDGEWTDLRGNSYRAALPNVTAPILSIAGRNDHLLSAPTSQARFVGATSGPVRHEVVGRATGYATDPRHMELVLDRRLTPLWQRIATFARDGE